MKVEGAQRLSAITESTLELAHPDPREEFVLNAFRRSLNQHILSTPYGKLGWLVLNAFRRSLNQHPK